jgi:hypothetical protein
MFGMLSHASPHFARRSLLCLALALVTISVGLALRLVPSNLPYFAVKYGGSVLWAIMVYLLVAVMAPSRRPATIALVSAIIAALVELSRLIHTPAFDAFRLTLAGKLLLGRVFSGWNILAYWPAIALAALIDRAIVSRSQP